MKQKIPLLFLLLLLAMSLCACSDDTAPTAEEPESTPVAETEPVEPEPEWVWQHDTPENQGLDPNVLTDVHATFDTFPLLTSVIVKNGYIVDEYYKEGYDETSTFILNSSSKSITSALIGIAITEGYIGSVEDPISQYLPRVSELTDSRWQQITIWDLLTHTSGIYSTDSELWNDWRASENWLEYIYALPIVSTPGETFSYSTGNTHLLSAILQEATGMTAREYAQEVLFTPLDMDSADCESDPQGISDGGNGFSMNVYDMAKFGQLYLNGGTWEGEQIVPAEWVTESTTLQFDRSSGSADYGYQWWVRTFGNQGYPAYFAQGHAGQYIFVVPDLELVIAFTSDYTGSTGIYWQLVNEIVNGCTAE